MDEETKYKGVAAIGAVAAVGWVMLTISSALAG